LFLQVHITNGVDLRIAIIK